MNIGDASHASGVSAKLIRHYEAIGAVPAPAPRASSYRNYDRQDVHRLGFVGRAPALGVLHGSDTTTAELVGGSAAQQPGGEGPHARAHRRTQRQDCALDGNADDTRRTGGCVRRGPPTGMSDHRRPRRKAGAPRSPRGPWSSPPPRRRTRRAVIRDTPGR